jgi:hypothetical protein
MPKPATPSENPNAPAPVDAPKNVTAPKKPRAKRVEGTAYVAPAAGAVDAPEAKPVRVVKALRSGAVRKDF